MAPTVATDSAVHVNSARVSASSAAPPDAAGESSRLLPPAQILLERWARNITAEVANAFPEFGNLALLWVTVSKVVLTGEMRAAQGSAELPVVVKCVFEVQPAGDVADFYASSKAEGAPTSRLARASSALQADSAAQMCATSKQLLELVLEPESNASHRSRHAVPACVHSTLGEAGDAPLCVAFERLSAGRNLFEELFRFRNNPLLEGSVAVSPARRVGSVMRARILVLHALSLLETLARGRGDGRQSQSCAYADNWSPNFGVIDPAMIGGGTGVYLNDLDGVNACQEEGCVRSDYEHWEDLPVLLLIAECLGDESDGAEGTAEAAPGASVLELLSAKSLFSMRARLGLLNREYFEAVLLGQGHPDTSDIDT